MRRFAFVAATLMITTVVPHAFCGASDQNVKKEQVGGCKQKKIAAVGNNGLAAGQLYSLAMPTWALTPTSMNLFMRDSPIWYAPPYGPDVEFRLSYNSIDMATNRPADFGYKWNLNYNSFCMPDPLLDGIQVHMPDGGTYTYLTNDVTGGYIAPGLSFNTLTNLVNGGYQLTFPDGTVYTYGQQNSQNTNQWLLTTITDHYAHELKLLYTDSPYTRLVNVVDALSKTSTITYAESGLIQSITDPFGRSATMTYNNGCLATCTDMGGVTTTYEFYQDSAKTGLVKSVRTRDGLANFQYQLPDGDPDGPSSLSVTFADGTSQGFGYSAGTANVATRFTNSNGGVTSYYLGDVNFLLQGKITRVVTPDTNSVSYGYNDKLQVTQMTNQEDQVWQYQYNDAGSLTNMVAPDGYQLSYEYAANGVDVTRIIECGTNTLLRMSYTANREVAAMTNALNQITAFTYDNHGRVTDIADAAGLHTTFSYGNDQRLATISRAGTQVASFEYDNIGRVTSSTGPDNLSVTMAYDNLDRLISLTLPGRAANVWQYENNSLELAAATDDVGRRTLYAYNLTRQLSAVVGPDQSQVKFEYDKQAQRTGLTDTLGRRTSLVRDDVGRVKQKTYPGGGTEAWGYTPTGLVSTSQNARGVAKFIAHTSVGQPTSATYSDGTTSNLSWSWDTGRQVLTSSSDGWSANSYEYDALKRLTAVTENGTWGSNRFDYVYDALGRVTSVTWRCNALAQPHVASYAYDNFGRMTNVTSDVGATGYTYANAGLRITQMRYSNGSRVEYGHDDQHRLNSVLYKTLGGATDGQWSYTYDAASRIAQRTDPAGRVFTYGYDVMDRLTEALGTSNTSAVAGYPVRYVYDKMGNRLAQAEAHQQKGLAINSDNQTTNRSSQGLEVIGWVNESGCTVKAKTDSMSGWQSVGMRYASSTQTWFSALGLPATNNGQNTLWVQAVDRAGNASTSMVQFTRSSQGSSEGVSYDADGNRTSSAAGSFAWDAESQLVRMDPTGGGHQECRYDGAGRLRELREYNGNNQLTNTTRYIWNGWLLWAELDGTNGLKRTYTWGPDVSGALGGAGGIGGLVASRDYGAGTTQYYRHDGLGNVTEVRAAADNSVLCSYVYAPFGQIVAQTGTYQQPFRFQSKLFLGSCGLGYWGYRWYDPASGLWMSKDPLREAGGLNMYMYCANNPINLIDPWGLEEMETGVIIHMIPKANLPPAALRVCDVHYWLEWKGGVTSVNEGALYGHTPNHRVLYFDGKKLKLDSQSYKDIPDVKKLDPCKYDFDKLHQAITAEVNRYFTKKDFAEGFCEEWVNHLWAVGKEASRIK